MFSNFAGPTKLVSLRNASYRLRIPNVSEKIDPEPMFSASFFGFFKSVAQNPRKKTLKSEAY